MRSHHDIATMEPLVGSSLVVGEEEAVEGAKSEIGWGSQIRSYVLHPYKMVKDHRTNFESHSPDDVLDGDLDQFINEWLAKKQANSVSS